MSQVLNNIANSLNAVDRIPIFSNILEVICHSTDMGFAAIALVTEDKWIACAVKDEINFGLKPGGELTLETTICNEIRIHQQPVIIEHVAMDPSYAKHHTPEMYGFQSYISVPIFLKNGLFFGTLCAIDPKPANINNPKIKGMFTLFAELIAFHLHALEEITLSEKRLIEEKKNAELREQFIAILGHDLRNPVSAVAGSAQLQLRMPMDEQAHKLVTTVKPGYFRTSFLSEGSLVTPATPITEYENVRASQAAHQSQINNQQPGDPQKAVEVLIRIAAEENPPLHLFLGADAYDAAAGKIDMVQAEMKTWEALATSTNFG